MEGAAETTPADVQSWLANAPDDDLSAIDPAVLLRAARVSLKRKSGSVRELGDEVEDVLRRLAGELFAP